MASADENGDAIADWYNDDFMQPWAEALEFTYGGADADDDNDGVSTSSSSTPIQTRRTVR